MSEEVNPVVEAKRKTFTPGPCGRIKVSVSLTGGFHAFLGEPDSGGGRWVADGRTAKAAIRNVITMAKAELARIGAIINGL